MFLPIQSHLRPSAATASADRATRRRAVAAGLVAATALSGLSPAAAQVLEYRWDTGSEAGIQSGDGIWSDGVANWTLDGGESRVAWDNTVLSDAEFGANTKTVTLGDDITVNRIRTSNSTNLTISQDPILAALGITSTIFLGGTTNAGIGNDGSRNSGYTINVPIELQSNATIGAFGTGGRPIRLNEVISQKNGSTFGLTLGASFQNSDFYIVAANTYGGQTNIGGGNWYLGSNTPFGTGTVRLTAGYIATFRGDGGAREIANNFTMSFGGSTATGIAVAGDHDFKFTGQIETVGSFTTGMPYRLTAAAGRTAEFTGSLVAGAPRLWSKTGAGTVILSGSTEMRNTATLFSSFSVLDGTLVVNGTIGGNASNALTVSSTATLGGRGTVQPATTISGTHSPGSSPGVQTFTNGITYATNSTFVFELVDNTVVGRGTNYDGVDVTGGALAIESGVTSSLVFDALGSNVLWNNSFWAADRSWLVFQNALPPALTSASAIFDTLEVSPDSGGNTLASARPGAGFSWEQDGNNVLLVYAVPEPSTLLLAMAAAAGGLAVARLRRRRRGF